MTTESSEVVEVTKNYYDSDDANRFYFHVWGGEDIHIGIYDQTDDISEASRLTVIKMAKLIPSLNRNRTVLDLGSGFGGSARFLAKEYQCKVECLNLSKAQNDINRQLIKEAGLEEKILVREGNFEELPYQDNSFDVVWSQDSFLHSGRRDTVLKEAYRVLKPGGCLVYTDIMQGDTATRAELQPVLDRIHLESLSSVSFYRIAAKECRFREYFFQDLSRCLTAHYSHVLKELEERQSSLSDKISEDYIENMKKGLGHWINAGDKGLLRWGIFRFFKG